MKKQILTPRQVSRRGFLAASAVAAGGALMPGTLALGAEPSSIPPDCPSTDHFWYRLQPEGPYIDTQRDNKAFGFSDDTIFLSEDNGPDVGAIRPEGIRQTITPPVQQKEQRRMVPSGSKIGMDWARRGVVHQAKGVVR